MFNFEIVKAGNNSIVLGVLPTEDILPLAQDTAELFKYAEPYSSKSQHRLSAQFGKPYSFGSKTYQDRTNQENKETVLKLFNLAKDIVPSYNYNGIHINYYQPALLTSHNSMLGWHTDAEVGIDNSVPILSLSLGTSMTFQIRDATGVYSFETGEGTIMLFDGRVEHRVLKQKETGVRVSITFRKHL